MQSVCKCRNVASWIGLDESADCQHAFVIRFDEFVVCPVHCWPGPPRVRMAAGKEQECPRRQTHQVQDDWSMPFWP